MTIFYTISYNLNMKKRILTGDTPTGKLHIGHYVGSLENRIKFQHEYDTYIILANVHAYANYFQNADRINDDVYNVFLDNLAVGIDPNVATIFLESGIPELFELYSFFLTMVKHSRVIRNPSVKEEVIYKKLDPSIAFIVYPLLQTADILGFNANLVPVGEDQLPVVEQAREIARNFKRAVGTIHEHIEELAEKGFIKKDNSVRSIEIIENEEEADIIIINTCSNFNIFSIKSFSILIPVLYPDSEKSSCHRAVGW